MRILQLALLLAALLAMGRTSHALEVIVDNDAPGCFATGTWGTQTTSCYGADKRRHAKGTGTDTFTWAADLPPGWYRVQFRINSNTTYAADARYTVQHRDGSDELVVNQVRSSSSWYLLGGSFYFDGQATVTLSDQFTTGSYVVADALRFHSVFSFVQMSDSHIGHAPGTADTTLVTNELKTLGQVQMAGYGFTAPPPSFAIHTGDVTEYGAQYWGSVQSVFSGLPFPLHIVSGNHDSTWNALREHLRTRQGRPPYYSFDHYDRGDRYHFVMLDSPILQSPRAGFARQMLDWLARDLEEVGTTTPVFLACHHYVFDVADPKPYDNYQLFDMLRPYNAAMLFFGHGHNFNTQLFDNLRLVQGGSTYDAAAGKRGYNLITVSHDRVHVAKKVYGEPTAATGVLNNMLIPPAGTYATITVDSPTSDSLVTASSVGVSASIDNVTTTVAEAHVELDGDGNWRPLAGSGYGPYTGSVSLSGAVHGLHWVRVRFTMATGAFWYKTTRFWHWDANPRAWWMTDLGAASQCAPAVANGRVFVGTNGGSMQCFDAVTGARIWRVDLPGDVISSPVVADGAVYFGCGDSRVYCLLADNGATLWSKLCSGPVYSPPVVDAGTVYIGNNGTGVANTGYIYAINAATGAEVWKYPVGYSIELRPCVTPDTVIVGSWDSYIYAINRATGTLRWRTQRNSNRYYSPADSWPVAVPSANRVYLADRESVLNVLNLTTGAVEWTRTAMASQGLTPDGTDVLLRNTAGTLQRIRPDGTSVWSASCSLDSAPVAPTSAGNWVAVANQHGLVTVLNAATGAQAHQFQVARGYQLHPVTVDASGNVFAATYDGMLMLVGNANAQVEDWRDN